MLRRLLGLTLALGLGWVAWQLSRQQSVSAPWLERWAVEHPGPRAPDAEALQRVAREFAVDRGADLFGLCLALSVAALALALAPGRWLATRGATLRLLSLGAVAGGAVSMAGALADVSELARHGRWTLTDDSLSAYVGPLEATLRGWRARIPAEQAVIVLGTNDFLLSRVGWALFPRPIHPVVLPRPAGLELTALAELAATLDLGRSAPGRWLVDLDALAASRPALARINP